MIYWTCPFCQLNVGAAKVLYDQEGHAIHIGKGLNKAIEDHKAKCTDWNKGYAARAWTRFWRGNDRKRSRNKFESGN